MADVEQVTGASIHVGPLMKGIIEAVGSGAFETSRRCQLSATTHGGFGSQSDRQDKLCAARQRVGAPEVGDAQVGLLAVAEVGLGDEDVPHGQHTQATDLLGRVEDDRRESRGHLGVQPDLDALQPGNPSLGRLTRNAVPRLAMYVPKPGGIM